MTSRRWPTNTCTDAAGQVDRTSGWLAFAAASSEITCRIPRLAKICQRRYDSSMGTMNISLPDALKSFVDDQVTSRGFGTSSEYVRELIRRDQDRLHLRGLLLAGANSKPSAPANAAYFASLRERLKHRPRR